MSDNYRYASFSSSENWTDEQVANQNKIFGYLLATLLIAIFVVFVIFSII